jgi:hypothetical protein
MVHCKPAELLLAEQGLTKPTERMLKHFAGCVTWTLSVQRFDVNSLMTGAPQRNAESE